MSELEKLLQQKKEINERIRQLKAQAIICGTAKYDTEHYPTDLPDRHFIAVNSCYNYLGREQTRWKTIINGGSRSDLIEKIPPIINDLQTLYNTLKEEEND